MQRIIKGYNLNNNTLKEKRIKNDFNPYGCNFLNDNKDVDEIKLYGRKKNR